MSFLKSWLGSSNIVEDKSFSLIQLFRKYQDTRDSEYFKALLLRVEEGGYWLSQIVARLKPEMREDFIQEIFVKLPPRFLRVDTDKIINVQGFVYRAVKNLYLDYKDKTKPGNNISIDSLTPNLHPASHEIHPGKKRDMEFLQIKCIRIVGEYAWSVLVMVRKDGKKFREAAEELGVTEAAVKGIIFRSDKKLRKSLGELYKKVFKN